MENEKDEGSVGADLAQAWDEAEAADTTTTDTEDTTDATGSETLSTDLAGGEPPADTGTDTEQPAGADDPGVPGGTGRDNPPETALDTPPVSLPPDAREAWKDCPPALKAAIAKREKDYENGIVKYSQDAKRAQQMDAVLNQYQPYLAMTGESVGVTVNTLLRTASNLHMAPPAHKAQIIAGLINQYGVPIDVLDGILAGAAPQPNQPDAIDQRIQQAIAPFQTILQQQQQRQAYEQQQAQQRISTELQDFAKNHEFYSDVATDMADFLDVAARNGRQMTLDDAYNRACANNPQISTILAARSRQPTPSQQAAASTLRGGPGGATEAAAPDTLKAALEHAWDTAGRL